MYNWSACDDHQTVDDEKCSDDTQSGIDCYEPLSYRYVVPLPQYYGRVRQRKKLKRFSIRRLISGYAIKYNKKPYSYASAKCDDDSIHSEDEYMSVKSHFSDTQVVGEIDTVVDDVDGMSCRAQFEEGNATAVELNGYDNGKLFFPRNFTLKFWAVRGTKVYEFRQTKKIQCNTTLFSENFTDQIWTIILLEKGKFPLGRLKALNLNFLCVNWLAVLCRSL